MESREEYLDAMFKHIMEGIEGATIWGELVDVNNQKELIVGVFFLGGYYQSIVDQFEQSLVMSEDDKSLLN